MRALSTMAARGGEAAVWSALMSVASPGKAALQAAAARRHETVAIVRENLALLGLDPRTLPPCVHIAGTKGKGSTAAMTESLLHAHGLRTLCYTSPHLTTVRERFRLNCAPIQSQEWCDTFWPVYEACVAKRADGAPSTLSFFGLLTVLCFSLASRVRVDALILEVGVGGLTDATNAVAAQSVACTAVTTLDWDHMDVLGSTLDSIAAHKAGVFKPGVPAVCAPQREDALRRLRAVAAHVGAPLSLARPGALRDRNAGQGFPKLALEGDFQRVNASLAVALCETFLSRVEGVKQAQAELGACSRHILILHSPNL